ncbi:LysR family transcriptional regulator [Vibrio sp. SCSIO 43136]|uniref:LysR family transcriptional regulator n=1 Tax=Vibrio sp. SCSIO 43136 TaxID=2819101 RepID=UPI0020758042|nr:LysR family transcriptional regulator [Vibrio sp. SCSIO 43136]USD67092.1 LysR family transcriptional regulator [Vibrio sp. SCSIO 43136]
MNISEIDLNLLFILKRLLEEKHVSNTATALNMSQSSVSRALKKMRDSFDDELLVRSHHGYELTPKAESIKSDITTVINSLEKLLHKQSFDPRTVRSTVRFYGLQPQIDALMPKVIAKVREQAPKMTVSIDSAPKRHFEGLINGDVHFVLSSHVPPSSEQNLYRMVVAKRTFRLLMNRDHPLAKGKITVDRLRHCQFGQISLQGEKSLSFEHKYKELGLIDKNRKLNIPVQISNFNSAASIAAETDIIFHLPTPFAMTACLDERLVVREVPEEQQLEFNQVSLYWHRRFHDDPMCEWVRSLFKQLYGSSQALA